MMMGSGILNGRRLARCSKGGEDNEWHVSASGLQAVYRNCRETHWDRTEKGQCFETTEESREEADMDEELRR